MNNRRITILCNSFPPETGGAPGRIHRMACMLRDAGYAVQVICCMPNYPKGKIFPEYMGKLVVNETVDGIRVKRLWLVPSNSQSLWRRGFSLFSYLLMLALVGFPALVGSRPSKIIISSPPLPMAFSGMLMARLLRISVLLNISDIWPLSAKAMGAMRQGFTYKVLHGMERFLYRHAAAWMGQSEEILSHIRASSRRARPQFLYRNLQRQTAAKPLPAPPHTPRRIVYAGLLGHAQGVAELIRQVPFATLGAMLDIYGDGSECSSIKEWISANPDAGVQLHETVVATSMDHIMATCDAVLVPLRVPIHGAVPSKLFMAVRYGKPVLFCAGGEGAALVAENGLGWISEPGDAEGLKAAIGMLCSMSDAGYAALRENSLQAQKSLLNEAVQQAGFLDFFSKI